MKTVKNVSQLEPKMFKYIFCEMFPEPPLSHSLLGLPLLPPQHQSRCRRGAALLPGEHNGLIYLQLGPQSKYVH